MRLKKTRSLGNGQLESECVNCGALIVWQGADIIFPRVDDDGQVGLLCPKCDGGANQSGSTKRQ